MPKAKVVSKPKSKVTMLEYSIKMVIPTGAYANIQPEIKVMADNPDDAHDYITPHMNKMWKEYFMVNERREEVAPKQSCPVVADVPTVPNSSGTTTVTPETTTTTFEAVSGSSPISDAAVIKATNMLDSCKSLEALDIIKNQIELSTKILKEEKPALRMKVVERFNELNADEFIKRNA